MKYKLECRQLTFIGDRQINQDCMAYKVTDDYGLFVVADGLGGHYGGEKASKFFCQALLKSAPLYQQLLQVTPHKSRQIFVTWMRATVDEMERLFLGDKHAHDAHTTCAILYLDENITATIHCGDSRIYRLNPGKITWRTKDHSVIQQQFNEGSLSERDMGTHAEQNQLVRSININKQFMPEINIYSPVKKGETFILCSDGFWEYVKEADLLNLASLQTDKNELKKVIKMAHLRALGQGDNITAQWVRYV